MSKKNDLRIREEAGRQIAFEEAGVHICRRLERERGLFREKKREGGGLWVVFIHETTRPVLIFLTLFCNVMQGIWWLFF